MPGRRLLDYAEAAEYLGLTVSHIKRLAYRGDIPYVKTHPGRQGYVRFDLADLDRWVESHKVSAS